MPQAFNQFHHCSGLAQGSNWVIEHRSLTALDDLLFQAAQPPEPLAMLDGHDLELPLHTGLLTAHGLQQMCMLCNPSLSCLTTEAVKQVDSDYIPKSQLHSMIGDQPNMSFQL